MGIITIGVRFWNLEHITGKLNELPDYLSRHPEPVAENPKTQVDEIYRIALNPVINPYEYIESKQREDVHIRQLKMR